MALNPILSSAWGASQGTISVNDGEATVTGTGNYAQIGSAISLVSGHKYLAIVDAKSSDGVNVSIGSVSFTPNHKYFATTSAYQTIGRVYTASSPLSTQIITITSNNGNGKTYTVKNPQVFDLTQMFGTAIADYIDSLEQANAGDGVAWFKQYFPNDYYAYDAGSLKSVEGLSAHIMTGFNQWDEQWQAGGLNDSGQNTNSSSRIRSKNYIPAIPNTTYYTNGALQVYGYDYDKNPIGWIYVSGRDGEYTTPANCGYVRFRTTTAYGEVYHNDICINISDANKNGTYEPYEGKSYSLDSSLTLRGISQLNSKNKLSFKGDVYSADGTVTRKYGTVDLGTLNWSYSSNFFRSAGIQTAVKHPATQDSLPKAICSKYSVATWNALGLADKEFSITTSTSSSYDGLLIKDTAYSDAASFKAAMSGVYLVYELATQTTETAKPFNDVQWCSTEGIEAFDTTSIVPVGHDTKYYANLAKNVAQTDGCYENMTSGNAEQLVSSVYEEDSEPYLFRTSGGSMDIGDREEDTIVGGTVAWNQRVQNGNFADGITGWKDFLNASTVSVSNGVLTAVENNTSNNVGFGQNLSISGSHKFLIRIKIDEHSEGVTMKGIIRSGGQFTLSDGMNESVLIGDNIFQIGVTGSTSHRCSAQPSQTISTLLNRLMQVQE